MEIQNTEIPGLKIISPFLQVIISMIFVPVRLSISHCSGWKPYYRCSLYQMATHLINYYTQNMLL